MAHAIPTCAHRDCRRHATHHIGVRFNGILEVKSAITLLLCHKHAIDATQHPERILTDESWSVIEAEFKRANKFPPDRDKTTLFAIQGLPKMRKA